MEQCIRGRELGHEEVTTEANSNGRGRGKVYLSAGLKARTDEVARAQQEAIEVGPARGERGSHGVEAGSRRPRCPALLLQPDLLCALVYQSSPFLGSTSSELFLF